MRSPRERSEKCERRIICDFCKKLNFIKIRKEYIGIIPHRAAVGAVTTAIPLYLIGIGGRPTDVGFILFLGSIGTLLGVIIWGNLSNLLKINFKILIILGTISFSVSTFLFVSTSSIILLSAIYFVLNLFFAATVPGITKMVFELFSREEWEKEHGTLNTIAGWAWTSGILLSIVLSLFLDTVHILLIFGIENIFSIPIFMSIRNISHKEEHKKLYRNYQGERPRFIPLLLFLLPSLRPLRDRRHRSFFGFVFLIFFVTGFAVPQFTIFTRYQIENDFWPYVVSFIWNTGSNLWYVRVSRELINNSTLHSFYNGIALRLLGFSVFSLAISLNIKLPELIITVIAAFVLGISWSYISISTLSYIGKGYTDNERDDAISMYNFVNGLSLSIGNFAGGICVDFLGFSSTFLLAIVILVISTILINKYNFERSSAIP